MSCPLMSVSSNNSTPSRLVKPALARFAAEAVLLAETQREIGKTSNPSPIKTVSNRITSEAEGSKEAINSVQDKKSFQSYTRIAPKPSLAEIVTSSPATSGPLSPSSEITFQMTQSCPGTSTAASSQISTSLMDTNSPPILEPIQQQLQESPATSESELPPSDSPPILEPESAPSAHPEEIPGYYHRMMKGEKEEYMRSIRDIFNSSSDSDW